MICKFCQKEVPYSPLELTGKSRGRVIHVYFCNDCKAEYVFFVKSEDMFSYSLYTVINGRTYRWAVYSNTSPAPHSNTSPAPRGVLFHVGEPGIPGVKANAKVKQIIALHDVPDLTPQNIEAKVRTILTFM
jgi:hypothetical protein